MTTTTAKRKRPLTRTEERAQAARVLRASIAMQSMRSALRELEACGCPFALRAHKHVKEGMREMVIGYPDDRFITEEERKWRSS